MKGKTRSAWAWVPTLYFAEGIPYFIVNTISVIMLKKMGMSNGDVAMFTGLLNIPWAIKPLWSPFVDILRTKRWWVGGRCRLWPPQHSRPWLSPFRILPPR